MGLPFEINPLILSSSTSWNISNSLRFRSAASASLSKSFSTAPTSTTTRTFSFWVKRGKLGVKQVLISGYDGSSVTASYISFESDDTLSIDLGGTAINLQKTTAVFRDTSSWYHIVVSFDTSNATAANRIGLYVNGVQQTISGTAVQNAGQFIRNSGTNAIGANFNSTASFFDGYIAEFYCIDGSVLTPYSFGSLNSFNIWIPIPYTSTFYGTNGFYLKFDTPTVNNDITPTAIATSSYDSYGVVDTLKYADGSYFTSTGLAGQNEIIMMYKFSKKTQIKSFLIQNYYLSGQSVTLSVNGSNDAGDSQTSLRTLSVTTTSASSGVVSLFANYQYYILKLVYTTGFTFPYPYLVMDAFLLYQDGIGIDSSGNANQWTPINISMTNGVTYDAMTDTPMAISKYASNYATLNQLDYAVSNTSSYGNLRLQGASGVVNNRLNGSIYFGSGSYYFETTLTTAPTGSGNAVFGVRTPAGPLIYVSSGSGVVVGVTSANTSYVNGDVYGFAIDATSNTASRYRNGAAIISNASFTRSDDLVPFVQAATASTMAILDINFGQRPFAQTAPTGFLNLNTYNLPMPTILNGQGYMSAVKYTGISTYANMTSYTASVNNTINFVGWTPDLVWIKNRSTANTPGLIHDTLRGSFYTLQTSNTYPEYNGPGSYDGVGFNFGNNTISIWGQDATPNAIYQNMASNNYIAWEWLAGQNTTVRYTNGSITSNVSVSQASGFSIVKYTGTSSNNANVGHGLNITPSMIISKYLSNTTSNIANSWQSGNWNVYHTSMGPTKYMYLNSNSAAVVDGTRWANTAPTNNLFTLGTSTQVNQLNGKYIAYCWAQIPGYSSFGSYTGNGLADGPFVYTGFRPKFVMIKNSTTGGGGYNWGMYDTSRNTYNVTNNFLPADINIAESGTVDIDILSNGFKLRTTNAAVNGSGATMIYATFAENPFKYALAR